MLNSHLRLLGHAGTMCTRTRIPTPEVLSIMAAYCLLPIMMSFTSFVTVLCCAGASASASAMQVQVWISVSYVNSRHVLVTFDVSGGSHVRRIPC